MGGTADATAGAIIPSPPKPAAAGGLGGAAAVGAPASPLLLQVAWPSVGSELSEAAADSGPEKGAGFGEKGSAKDEPDFTELSSVVHGFVL